MAGRGREGEAERSWAVESWKNKTRVVWCAPMWALRERDEVMIEGERKKSGKQIVEERRERRVRLLHTVQHARQNTTSLCRTTATNAKYSKELFCRSRELTRAQLYRVIANCPTAEKPGLITLTTTNAISCLCFLSSHCSHDKHDTCCADTSLYR